MKLNGILLLIRFFQCEIRKLYFYTLFKFLQLIIPLPLCDCTGTFIGNWEVEKKGKEAGCDLNGEWENDNTSIILFGLSLQGIALKEIQRLADFGGLSHGISTHSSSYK